jgi:hypothetical protein
MKKLFMLLFLMTISLGQSQTAAPSAAGKNSWDVISVFSGAYTDLASTNFNPGWGQSGENFFTTPSYGGDAVKQYANFNYQGTETLNDVNASSFPNMHIDIYSATLTSIRLSVIKTTGGTVEKPITLTLTPGAWTSFDLDLTSATFTGLDLTKIRQLKYDEPKISGTVTNGQTFSVDNIYFWRTATSQPVTLSNFSVPAKFVGDSSFSLTAPTTNGSGAFTYTSSNTAVATISGSTVTIVGPGTSSITATQAGDGTYTSGFISANLAVTYATPSSAAPTAPARNAWDVVSVYSSAYTDIAATDFNPNWGQSGFGSAAEVALSGDNARHYPNFNYQGNQLGSTANVASMTTLHLDIYSNNLIGFDIRLIGGGEFSVILSPAPVAGQWNSYDIPLSSFGALNKAAVAQLKYQTSPFPPASARDFYIDNIYFYRAATAAPPATLGALTIPNKYVGDAAFSLTAPTTNSSGAFTYTSSNLAVATISGSTVTIVGKGTSTITATQAADASYSAASTTASLVVSLPPPSSAAPTPTVAAGNVIKVFSDAAGYGPANTNNFFPNWGQNTVVTTPSIAGNATLLYSNLNYEGTILTPNVNLTGYVSMHLDVWTPDCTSLSVYLINTAGVENAVTVTPSLAANASASWNQFDILLSSYPHSLAAVKEIKIVGTNGSTVYLDNIYFSNLAITVNPIIGALTIPTKPVGSANFNITAPTTNSPGAITYTSSNSAVATIAGTSITVVGLGSTTITASQAASGSYNSGSVTGTFTVVPSAPSAAAPAPPVRGAADVVSVFSGAYTNVAGTNFNPDWGQAGLATHAQVAIAGNNTLHYPNMNYQGVQFASNLNVSSMTNLHLDIWTPVSSSVRVFSIPGGAASYVDVPLTIGSWTSVDIPMASFNLTANQLNGVQGVNQFKFEATPFGGSNLFIDNVYFWKPNNIPSFGAFTIPAKFTTSANFTITPPTSTSSGAITYTSSNTAVATIVNGNQIDVVGAGSTTITANQAAVGSTFLAASTTATLVVTYSPPTVAATSPTLPAFQVMSVFSNKYATTSGVGANSFVPNWGQNAVSQNVSIAGNTTKKYPLMNYHGVQFDSPLNVSNMEAIHLDIYSSNCTSLDFYLINQAVREVKKTIALPIQSGWNSINIPISDFLAANAALDLTNIGQFKLDNTTGTRSLADIYIDNMYFYNDGLTQLRSNQCGKTLTYLSDAIQANPIVGATEYTFEVTRIDNNAVYTIVSPKYYFFPAYFITNGLIYGKSYSIRVKAKIGTYGEYSTACVVTAPAEPAQSTLTKIRSLQCGKTMTYITDAIQANPVYLATQYEFNVTDGVTTIVIPSSTYWFRLSKFPGGGVLNTEYTISVRSKGASTAFTAYGDPCVVKTPIARMSDASTNDVFEVKSFPNPFASHFNLDIESSSDAQVEMKVYDMIGRQLEVRKASVSELSVLEVGRNYPTGIYNLVVSQGKNVKSIRMIKR